MSSFDAYIVLPNATRRAVNFPANALIASLPEQEMRHISPYLKPVQLTFNEGLCDDRAPIEHVYFPLNCVVSSVILMEDGAAIETAMTGREGLIGVASLLGTPDARQWTRVSVPGTALALERRVLNNRFAESPSIQQAVLIAYWRLINQVSQRAVCNARHTILERLCCWLLMLHDRVGGDDLRITQESIAMRLGSRRAGITQAASVLRAMRAISYVRGVIVISDRKTLERAACECYEGLRTDIEDSPIKVLAG